MIVRKRSEISGNIHEMEIPITEEMLKQWEAYGDKGPLIQDFFPQLNTDEREFLLTGISKAEWAAAFPDDDDYLDTAANDEV